MKVLILLALSAMASVAALAALLPNQQAPLVGVNSWDEPPEVSLIQLSEGDTRWVTDEQKWALKMVSYPVLSLLGSPNSVLIEQF